MKEQLTEERIELMLKEAASAFPPPDGLKEAVWTEVMRAAVGQRASEGSGRAPEASEGSLETSPHRCLFGPLPWLVQLPRRVLKGAGAMKPAHRLVVIAVAVVAIVGMLTWLSPGDRGPGLAFADVVERLNEVQSATFRFTVQVPGQPEATGRGFILEPGRVRCEWDTGLAEGLVQILNPVLGKNIAVLTKTKKVTVNHDGATPASVNFLTALRRMTDKATGSLDDREIDGRVATGFRIDDGSLVVSIWADRESGLPLLIQYRGIPPHGGGMTWSDFEYNVDLDESLFDFEPPPDYTVEEKSEAEWKALWSAVQCKGHLTQIAVAFMDYLRDNENEYPETLDDLLPYLEGPEVLRCPSTGEDYVYVKPTQPLLISTDEDQEKVVVVFDRPGNHPDGRNVLFANLHPERLGEEEFQKLWAEEQAHAAPEE